MANALTANPLYIDTASAEVSGIKKIIALIWSDFANAQACLLKDSHGNVIFSATGVTGDLAPIVVAPSLPLIVDGLEVTTLGGGKLVIWLA